MDTIKAKIKLNLRMLHPHIYSSIKAEKEPPNVKQKKPVSIPT